MSDDLRDQNRLDGGDEERETDAGLDAAIGALRAHGKAQPEDVKRVKRRVIESLSRAPAKPRRVATWVFPIAAVLAATTALAASGKLRVIVEALTTTEPSPNEDGRGTRIVDAPRKGAAGQPSSEPSAPPPPPSPLPEAKSEPEVDAPTPPSPPAPTGQNEPLVSPPTAHPSPSFRATPPSRTAPSTAASASPTPSSPSSTGSATTSTSGSGAPVASAPDPERLALVTYKTAHALHFSSRDYAAALPAWDEYLAKYPNGTLAHEARYNRAICLATLGRTAEAATALQPFARGAVANGYRQSEARALLDAMDAGK